MKNCFDKPAAKFFKNIRQNLTPPKFVEKGHLKEVNFKVQAWWNEKI